MRVNALLRFAQDDREPGVSGMNYILKNNEFML